MSAPKPEHTLEARTKKFGGGAEHADCRLGLSSELPANCIRDPYTPSAAATTRFGAFPTFTRFTSHRARTSIIDTSFVPVLLTHTYFPSGENVTQFGPSPTCTRPTILFAFTS